jgi:hypothetical protein
MHFSLVPREEQGWHGGASTRHVNEAVIITEVTTKTDTETATETLTADDVFSCTEDIMGTEYLG